MLQSQDRDRVIKVSQNSKHFNNQSINEDTLTAVDERESVRHQIDKSLTVNRQIRVILLSTINACPTF